MQTPTIVKQTKDYFLIKVPLPKRGTALVRPQKNDKMTIASPLLAAKAEKRLWKVIQEGEKEYCEGKTIRASSIDEALKVYERKQKSKSR